MELILIIGTLFATAAAVLHVFIFVLETIVWQSALARKTFGMSPEKAAQTKEMAANQGVYNLLLAIITFVGIAMILVGFMPVGMSLALAGTGSMFLAAAFLFVSSPDKKAAAVKQAIFPLLTIVLLVMALA